MASNGKLLPREVRLKLGLGAYIQSILKCIYRNLEISDDAPAHYHSIILDIKPVNDLKFMQVLGYNALPLK